MANPQTRSKVVMADVADRPRESCFPMISVAEAYNCILAETDVLETQLRNFNDCFSHVISDDIRATEPHPPFQASIKDGYAVIGDDPSEIRNVIGVVSPGKEDVFNILPGQCIRISTGAAIPKGTDAVIQVEDTQLVEKDCKGNELRIRILKPAKHLQDIRPIGCDVSKGEIILSSLTQLMAAHMGALATCGIQMVTVHRKPTVALLSTGDEVIEPNSPLKPGCIRDSNKTCLTYMLTENLIPVVNLGISNDSPDDIKLHLIDGFHLADIIITTGGVSMGEKDLVKEVLLKDFDAFIHFGRICMKPGKPTTFSTALYENKKKMIFSLPGNPVSAFVCFTLFVMPCIKKMMGLKGPYYSMIKVELAHDIQLDERPEYYRVNLRQGDKGYFIATGTGPQQSSRLLTMQADALLKLPPSTKDLTLLAKGSIVDAVLLHSL